MTVIVGAAAPLSWAPGGSGAAALAVRLPDGTVAPAPTVTATASPYAAAYVTTVPGRHTLTWTRADAISVDILDVWPTDPRYLISIADALEAVGSVPASKQSELPLYVATATWVLEMLAGPVLVAERTHRTHGGRGSLVLPVMPVKVTAIAVSGTTLDPSEYVVDEEAGVIYGSFASGRPLNVEVTYNVGSSMTPANLALAARALVAHLWRQDKNTGTPGSMEAAADMVATPFGFAIPKRVVELCSATPVAPGFA